MNIGDTVYQFDINRRVYQRKEDGRPYGSPIYSEHFRPIKIFGETSRSWLAGQEWAPIKILKNNPQSKVFTIQERDDAIWGKANALKLSDLVRSASTKKLRAIAEILEYSPETQETD